MLVQYNSGMALLECLMKIDDRLYSQSQDAMILMMFDLIGLKTKKHTTVNSKSDIDKRPKFISPIHIITATV